VKQSQVTVSGEPEIATTDEELGAKLQQHTMTTVSIPVLEYVVHTNKNIASQHLHPAP
jgi:hypothetical protein